MAIFDPLFSISHRMRLLPTELVYPTPLAPFTIKPSPNHHLHHHPNNLPPPSPPPTHLSLSSHSKLLRLLLQCTKCVVVENLDDASNPLPEIPTRLPLFRDVARASCSLLRRRASGMYNQLVPWYPHAFSWLSRFLPPTDDNLLTQIKDDFVERKDLVVSVIFVMREEQICALCMRATWVMAELALIEANFQELSL
ncbi:hypothetical protein AAG906_038813 [Vitis piasezkii]